MTAPPMFSVTTAASGAPAFKDMGLAWRQFMGIPDTAGPVWRTYADYARAPADEAWVYACVRRRYTAAMSVPLVVYVKDGPQRVPAADSSDQAAKDLQNLLDDVNPVDMQGGDLKAWLEAGLAVWGEGYIKKVRGRLGGPPQELYWLAAKDIKPDPDQGPITGYRYQDAATAIPARDVIVWRTVNLVNPRRGLSPLTAVRNEMRVDIAASENTAATLENWGVPPGAWVAPKGADISTQDQRLITRALKALRGPRNQGKTPVLPEGLDWKPLSLNPKDAEWLSARKVSRMTICAALGVPLVLAGDDEKTTVYANLRDAERVFWRNTMIPELDWVADGFNSWLVPDFAKDRHIVVAFDYSQIESLQDPVTSRKSVSLKEVAAGVLTKNQYVAMYRLGPPIPDGDGYEATAPTPATTMGETPPPPNPADVIRSLGRGLYKHEATKAYLATGDPTFLEQLVSPADVEALALGLQRRLPATKLAEHWDPAPTEPAAPPAPPVVNVKVDNHGPEDHARLLAMTEVQTANEERFKVWQESIAKMQTEQTRLVLAGMKDISEHMATALTAPAQPVTEVQHVERDERGRIVRVVKEKAGGIARDAGIDA